VENTTNRKPLIIGAILVSVFGTVVTIAIVWLIVRCNELAEQASAAREKSELFAAETKKEFDRQREVLESDKAKLKKELAWQDRYITSIVNELEAVEEDQASLFEQLQLTQKDLDATKLQVMQLTFNESDLQKEFFEMQEELKELKKAVADPGIGKNLRFRLELQSHYGERNFSNYIYFPKPQEEPSEELILQIKHMHEAVLGTGYFAEKFRPLLFPLRDDSIVFIGKQKNPSKFWRVSFEKLKPRPFAEQVINPMKAVPVLVNTQMFANGARLMWSRQPSAEQLKRVGPQLQYLAKALGNDNIEGGYWHDARTYVFILK
jgi:hypothetical protein